VQAGGATTNLSSSPPTTQGVDQRLGSRITEWVARAQGCEVYRGNAFPTQYVESVFIADPQTHVVHRVSLRENGLELVPLPSPDGARTEFLASKNASFRPAQVLNGPDGTLYIADTQDGGERGRIYRVVPDHYNPEKAPQLGKASTYDLVTLLAAGHGWQQDTASRLLFERQDPGAVPLLSNVVTKARLALARVRALYALASSRSLSEALVLKALQDRDARVREHAVLACESLIHDGNVSDSLWNQLKSLANDASLRVRYQLAFTAGFIRRQEKALLLAQILRRDPANLWVQNAVLSSTAEDAGSLFILLSGDSPFRNNYAGQLFLQQLAGMTGTKGRLDEVSQLLTLIARTPPQPVQTFAFLGAVGRGLHRTRSSLALVDPQGALQGFYVQALNTAIDTSAAAGLRIEATRFLAVTPYRFADVGDWLVLLANPQPILALRAAAVETMGRYDDPSVVPAILDSWAGFTPALRRQAFWALAARTSRIPAVLAAIEGRKIPLGDLSTTELNFLRTYPEPASRDSALRLFGAVPTRRPEARERFRAALQLRGKANEGARIYTVRCAGCHPFSGTGLSFGPELAGARTAAREKLLTDIIEPGADALPAYGTSVIQTEEGENLVGIVTDENPVTVTLSTVGGIRTVWPRLNLRTIEKETWSLMPDGLEQGLSTQEMADLLEYLMTPKTTERR
jgi:putative heme-binding domain-containing protein